VDREILGFEEIGLPEPVITGLLRRKRGLILVTGPTGSGKSTTLATMVDWINRNEDRHIVTIEDPVEHVHGAKRGLVTQREVGIDVPDFTEAMRRVVRQDPDVIMVGEMRDLATMAGAVTAAETGHLVLATLHTTGAAQTVSRVIDVFPSEQQAQIKVQLSASLLAVISQVLVPVAGSEGGPKRRAALEVLIATPAVANLIRHGEPKRIEDVIQTSRGAGMQTLDSHLIRLAKDRVITRDTALAFARDPQQMEGHLFG
jgi:twitching motility protein PilT